MSNKLMKGCEAIAEAAITAGCRYFFGYPITPQSEIPEYLSARLPEVGGVFLQAESEVAAINMVFGAAGAGARVMTSSSSPGISLKQEGISSLAAARLPAVIVNVMRGGPGVGNIQASQGDYFQATKGGGHGDYRIVVLAPASIQEAIGLVRDSFDIADKYRMPAMILADGVIAQMMESVEIDDGYVPLIPEKPWAATGYDPKGKKPRAVLDPHCGYTDKLALLHEKLTATYKEVTKNEIRYETYNIEDAEIILFAYGTVARVCEGAIEILEKEGIKVGLFRPISLWPFPSEAVYETLNQDSVKWGLAVEISSGQMVEDVRLAANGIRPVEFFGEPGSKMIVAEQLAEFILKKRSEK